MKCPNCETVLTPDHAEVLADEARHLVDTAKALRKVIAECKNEIQTRDQAIELARENMAKIIENMKPSEGDCMTCDNWPDRKQHHEECPYSNLVDTLTAIDNLLKGQK